MAIFKDREKYSFQELYNRNGCIEEELKYYIFSPEMVELLNQSPGMDEHLFFRLSRVVLEEWDWYKRWKWIDAPESNEWTRNVELFIYKGLNIVMSVQWKTYYIGDTDFATGADYYIEALDDIQFATMILSK